MSVPFGYVRHARTHTLYREATWARLVAEGRVNDSDGLRYVEPNLTTDEDRHRGRVALATLVGVAAALTPGRGVVGYRR